MKSRSKSGFHWKFKKPQIFKESQITKKPHMSGVFFCRIMDILEYAPTKVLGCPANGYRPTGFPMSYFLSLFCFWILDYRFYFHNAYWEIHLIQWDQEKTEYQWQQLRRIQLLQLLNLLYSFLNPFFPCLNFLLPYFLFF